MEKQQILSEIRQLATEKKITLKELASAFNEGNVSTKPTLTPHQNAVAKILYYLGGLVIFAGIIVLLWQHWDRLTFMTRLLATMGASIAFYIIGTLFNNQKKIQTIGNSFFLISMLVLPIGFYVLFDHLGYDLTNSGTLSIIAAILCFISVISYQVFRSIIFVIFNIIFGTWFIFVFTNYLINGNPYFAEIDFYSYRTMLVGIAYILLGYHFTSAGNKILGELLDYIGTVAVLGAILDLSGWKPTQNLFWEIVLPFACFFVIFLSISLKSRPLLIIGTLFLMIFIGKITSEYFVDNLGWPLALVIAGFSLIAIGYGSLKVHFHFHKTQTLLD